MNRLNGMQIFELLSDVSDELIVDSVPPALLAGAAAGATAASAANTMEITTPATSVPTRSALVSWFLKGGWIVGAVGALIALGIAVGIMTLNSQEKQPHAGSDSESSEFSGSVSGDEELESETIPCNHVFGEWIEMETATCTHGGTNTRTCAVCSHEEQERVIPIPHTFENNICTVCGEEASKLKFTSNGDGTCYVSGWGNVRSSLETLVIPTYSPDGERVLSIGYKAFGSGKARATPSSVIISEGVEHIEAAAFYGRSWLTSVTELGGAAFNNNGSLTEAVFADGCTLAELPRGSFASTRLTEITIPSTVTTIGEYAFWDCSLLTTVHMPDGITSIGEAAFANCTALTELPLTDALESLGTNALSGCIALPYTEYDGALYLGTAAEPYRILVMGQEGVTTAGIHPDARILMGGAFEGNTTLTSFTFPDDLTAIPDAFFSKCSALTSVNYPSSLTHIGASAFYQCVALTTLELPDGVLSIGGGAYNGCTGLTEVVLPDSITTMNAGVFGNCASLVSVTLPASLTYISDGLFSHCYELADSLTLPEGVTGIGASAFSKCMNLGVIYMPHGITYIGHQAFTVSTGSLHYDGTVAEWEAIEKDAEWNDHAHFDFVQCTDGSVYYD